MEELQFRKVKVAHNVKVVLDNLNYFDSKITFQELVEDLATVTQLVKEHGFMEERLILANDFLKRELEKLKLFKEKISSNFFYNEFKQKYNNSFLLLKKEEIFFQCRELLKDFVTLVTSYDKIESNHSNHYNIMVKFCSDIRECLKNLPTEDPLFKKNVDNLVLNIGLEFFQTLRQRVASIPACYLIVEKVDAIIEYWLDYPLYLETIYDVLGQLNALADVYNHYRNNDCAGLPEGLYIDHLPFCKEYFDAVKGAKEKISLIKENKENCFNAIVFIFKKYGLTISPELFDYNIDFLTNKKKSLSEEFLKLKKIFKEENFKSEKIFKEESLLFNKFLSGFEKFAGANRAYKSLNLFYFKEFILFLKNEFSDFAFSHFINDKLFSKITIFENSLIENSYKLYNDLQYFQDKNFFLSCDFSKKNDFNFFLHIYQELIFFEKNLLKLQFKRSNLFKMLIAIYKEDFSLFNFMDSLQEDCFITKNFLNLDFFIASIDKKNLFIKDIFFKNDLFYFNSEIFKIEKLIIYLKSFLNFFLDDIKKEKNFFLLKAAAVLENSHPKRKDDDLDPESFFIKKDSAYLNNQFLFFNEKLLNSQLFGLQNNLSRKKSILVDKKSEIDFLLKRFNNKEKLMLNSLNIIKSRLELLDKQQMQNLAQIKDFFKSDFLEKMGTVLVNQSDNTINLNTPE